MGYRTIIALINDDLDKWEKDPTLGKKIWEAACHPGGRFQYGNVIESAHADTQSMVIFDGYDGSIVSHSYWRHHEGKEDIELKMLKQLAQKHGYHLRKKPKPKAK